MNLRCGRTSLLLRSIAPPLWKAYLNQSFRVQEGSLYRSCRIQKGRIELASSGPYFSDEVGELPLPLQAKFLRFLEYGDFTRVGGNQTRQCEARIIAATNRNLKDLVQQGRFRQDLFFS